MALKKTSTTTNDNAGETWPEDRIDKEIIHGLREAKREALKTMESLGMLSSLQKANVVHVSKSGAVTSSC